MVIHALLGVFLSNLAHAGPAQEPIRIQYQSSGGCPTGNEFESLLFSRATNARSAEPGEEARTFIITLWDTPDGATGRLQIHGSNTGAAGREFRGGSCLEVATVLALASALAIDPRLLKQRPLEAPTPTPAPDDPAATPAAPPQLVMWDSEFAAGGQLLLGTTPTVAVGADAWLGGRSRAVGFGLAIALLGTTHAGAGDGATAQFFIGLAQPTLCSPALWLDKVRLYPCFVVELGGIRGTGAGLPETRSAFKFWSAVGGELQLDLVPGPTLVRLRLSPVVPMTRYEFLFEQPETHIHKVPLVVLRAGISLGLEF